MTSFCFRLLALVMSAVAVPAAVLGADAVPAKQLFGKHSMPSKQPTQSLGFYAKGCLAGGIAIPVDGPAWQVIHLSRNRRWGNPEMIALVERLARESKADDGWNGLMIGDISQPRGGPMLSGHASHQIGLDADIWLTPMPSHTMSYQEREGIPEASVLRRDMLTVDPRKWTKAHERLIVRAASYPQVERVFMHPGIKKKMCDTLQGRDRNLLYKMRPIYGHHYHFHIRMKCPAGSVNCEDQVDPGPDSGCGKQLTEWLNRVKPRPVVKPTKPTKPTKVVKPKHLMMSALPDACKVVLNAAPVPSMAEAEYRSGNPVQAPVTAYAEEDPVAKLIAVTSDDFSVFIPPMGSVPQPLVRPSIQ